jgi:hypothetical protein
MNMLPMLCEHLLFFFFFFSLLLLQAFRRNDVGCGVGAGRELNTTQPEMWKRFPPRNTLCSYRCRHLHGLICSCGKGCSWWCGCVGLHLCVGEARDVLLGGWK